MATSTAPSHQTSVRTSESPRFRLRARVLDVWGFREILLNLVRKDLRVKYTQSTLGAFWSLLNPILYLVVFSFVFSVVLKNDIPDFPFYLLTGLVVWNMFNGALSIAVRSVVDNTSLVKKVYFPKEILPLSSVGVAKVDFGIQVGVLIVAMLLFGHPFVGWGTLLFPLALVALVTFTCALAFLVAGMNVTYRDTQHLMSLALLTWFWFTPIVYKASLIQDVLSDVFGYNVFPIYVALNPIAPIVFAFQRAFYGTAAPDVLVSYSTGTLALILCWTIAFSAAILWLSWRSFFKLSGDFAEEL